MMHDVYTVAKRSSFIYLLSRTRI